MEVSHRRWVGHVPPLTEPWRSQRLTFFGGWEIKIHSSNNSMAGVEGIDNCVTLADEA